MPTQFKIIIRPKFVALDSSHLGQLARHMFSSDPVLRAKSAEFIRAMDDGGSVLLLCWHHLQELLSHENTDVVTDRVMFIKALPLVAFPRSLTDDTLVGSVIDVQAQEVFAAFSSPSADIFQIREKAALAMFRVGPGADLMAPFLASWPLLKQAFAQQRERAREVVAITRSGFAGMTNVKIVDLLRGTARTTEDTTQRLGQLHSRLASDILQRGDKRISDAEQTSAEFLDEVRRIGEAAVAKPNPVLQILLASGVELNEIGPDMTVRDVGELATFRKKLEVINRSLGLPWKELVARVTANRLPSAVIDRAIDVHRPDTREWKGSDLADSHLACLSPYADVTFVDKRTYEALAQARPKVPYLASILGRIQKSAQYSDAVDVLRAS